MNLITSGSGMYDLNNPDEMSQHVCIIWVTFLFLLGVTTFVTAYFLKIYLALKHGRKALWKKLRHHDHKDDSDSSSGSTSSASSLEEEDDPNVRKRHNFSSKAEDGGDYDGGGIDVGGDDGGIDTPM